MHIQDNTSIFLRIFLIAWRRGDLPYLGALFIKSAFITYKIKRRVLSQLVCYHWGILSIGLYIHIYIFTCYGHYMHIYLNCFSMYFWINFTKCNYLQYVIHVQCIWIYCCVPQNSDHGGQVLHWFYIKKSTTNKYLL